MTVMSTNTHELDIHAIVLLSYQTAGVMNEMQTAEGPQWDARAAFGRKQLELIVDALAADGIFERSVETYDVEVSSGEVSTELPSDTVDVRGPAMLLQDDETEFPLRALSRQEYADITIKEQSGTPSQFYVARTSPMHLYLWPVPDADCSVRLQRQRLTFDNTSGAATPDLERYWIDFLVHELASRVAISNGMPIDRVTMLTAKATSAKLAARGKSQGQLANRFTIGHRGPYTF